MNLYHMSGSKYLIVLKRRYRWREFRKSAKVAPGTYSEKISSDIYSEIFDYSANLLEEYTLYYRYEYDTVNSFLFWRYGVSEETLSKVELVTNKYITVFEFSQNLEESEIYRGALGNLLNQLDG